MILHFSVDEFATSLGVGYYILVYAIGFLAMALSIIAYQFKHRVSIILGTFFGQICWVTHFLLQGDLTSAIICALTAAMLAVFVKREQWNWVKSPFCIIGFIVLISGFSILSFAVWSDIFPLLAGIFAVIANSRSNEKSLRQFSVLFCFFWLMNSTFKLYPVAFINDLFCLISAVVSLIRYRNPQKESVSEGP
ncbi:MAG: YgjV family protein [Ruminococcaceae bacterium]|nr:YgjV family protein [Oscillospiraceae bacterium]